MENIIQRQHLAKVKSLFLFLACGILLLARADFSYAVTKTTVATGLSAAVGAAIDESKNQLYYVEYNAGTLRRINLPPQCGHGTPVPSCSSTIVPIATGFSHPEDVQLDMAHGFAYVTTRDDPGTTGALWKVNISTGAKTMVTFNLGAPQQLVMDTANNQAFVVGYDDGRLRRIDLTTGAKTPIYGTTPATKLGHPVGLTITKDRKYAYVTEQDAPARISKIDLTIGVKDPNPVVTGLTAPFFLAWTDNSQNSLYVVERDPVNRVSRVDLITSTKYEVVTETVPPPSWWWRPTGIVVGSDGMITYVTTDKAIVKVDMVDMAAILTEPVFTMVGHVPSTQIIAGYATTDQEYFFYVKHSPFGGTINISGNLIKFKAAPPSGFGAEYYQVEVRKDGGTFTPLNLSWNAYKFNPVKGEDELVPVAPDPAAPNPLAGPKYKIPDEYKDPLKATWWKPYFLMMRWPSGENGYYEFRVKLYNVAGTPIPLPVLPAKNSLIVRIDNTPPDVKILSIWQKGTPDKEIKPCDIVSTGNNQYYFKITAYDPNHHLLSYGLSALWGDNKSDTIASDSYDAHDLVPENLVTGKHEGEGPWWNGVINSKVPATVWSAKCNCAHTFYLGAWKRTIDGYNYILYRDYHKSITINNTGTTCP